MATTKARTLLARTSVDPRTALRTKMCKRLEEAHQELGDEAFYGLCGDLTEDLDDAMSEIDEERDGPLVLIKGSR